MGIAAPLAIPAAEAAWAGLVALGVTLGIIAAKNAADTHFSKSASDAIMQDCPKTASGSPPPDDDDDVPCFEQPKGTDPTEFDRQLAEQESAINKMSPEELITRRTAVKDLGTKALRQPEAQQLARDTFSKQRLPEIYKQFRNQGQTGADAIRNARTQLGNELGRLDATHELDIVAGGDAANISGMADRSVNRSIGSQWRGRVSSLDRAAQSAKARGASRMNVRLKRCK
jgi:hypothetical protein